MLTIKHPFYRVCLLMVTLFCGVLCPTAHSQSNNDLEDLDGNQIPIHSLLGKWVLINYWASWCGPCVDEIAEMNRFYAAHSKDKVALFAVNYEALTPVQQRQLSHQFDIHYPSLQLKSLRALHLGAVKVVPVTYVFDPEGHLVSTLYGGQTMRSLQEEIRV